MKVMRIVVELLDKQVGEISFVPVGGNDYDVILVNHETKGMPRTVRVTGHRRTDGWTGLLRRGLEELDRPQAAIRSQPSFCPSCGFDTFARQVADPDGRRVWVCLHCLKVPAGPVARGICQPGGPPGKCAFGGDGCLAHGVRRRVS